MEPSTMYKLFSHYQDGSQIPIKEFSNIANARYEAGRLSKDSIVYGTVCIYQNDKLIGRFAGGYEV